MSDHVHVVAGCKQGCGLVVYGVFHDLAKALSFSRQNDGITITCRNYENDENPDPDLFSYVSMELEMSYRNKPNWYNNPVTYEKSLGRWVTYKEMFL